MGVTLLKFDLLRSGKILHIDFGDCFEASMNREKFPEKVTVFECCELKNLLTFTIFELVFLMLSSLLLIFHI
jgi:hypothetical protein